MGTELFVCAYKDKGLIMLSKGMDEFSSGRSVLVKVVDPAGLIGEFFRSIPV